MSMKKDLIDFINESGSDGAALFGVAVTALCCLFLVIVGAVCLLKLIAPWWGALTDAQQGQLLLAALCVPPLIFFIKFLRFRKKRRAERVIKRMGV
jgi:hypothetical protein